MQYPRKHKSNSDAKDKGTTNDQSSDKARSPRTMDFASSSFTILPLLTGLGARTPALPTESVAHRLEKNPLGHIDPERISPLTASLRIAISSFVAEVFLAASIMERARTSPFGLFLIIDLKNSKTNSGLGSGTSSDL